MRMFLWSLAIVLLTGCAGIPGKTADEQIDVLERLHDETLADLFNDHPEARAQIARSAGYAVMDNTIVKIPLVGAGSGYGIAVERETGNHTYIKMVRFDFGAGWGARDVRPVLIMYDRAQFEAFRQGKWLFDAGAEASAKAGEHGAAGGAGASGIDPDRTYDLYLLTDSGVSATFTAAMIRVAPVSIRR